MSVGSGTDELWPLRAMVGHSCTQHLGGSSQIWCWGKPRHKEHILCDPTYIKTNNGQYWSMVSDGQHRGYHWGPWGEGQGLWGPSHVGFSITFWLHGCVQDMKIYQIMFGHLRLGAFLNVFYTSMKLHTLDIYMYSMGLYLTTLYCIFKSC